MRRVLLLLYISMLSAFFLYAAADKTSVKTLTSPSAGDSVVTMLTYNVGDASTDWFSVSFTDKAFSSFDEDFTSSSVSEIPLSLNGNKAVNTSPVYVSWVIVTAGNVDVLLKKTGVMKEVSDDSKTIGFSITADEEDTAVKEDEETYIVLCSYNGDSSSTYGIAGSKEINIETETIGDIANGEYKSTISILVESVS